MSLGLIASLLMGHSSACSCSHHVENETVEASDCHSHHDETKASEAISDSDACDVGCVCVVEQPSPFASSKAPAKEFKAADEPATVAAFLADVDFVEVASRTQEAPSLFHDLSYSSTLKSLPLSRAPPRL